LVQKFLLNSHAMILSFPSSWPRAQNSRQSLPALILVAACISLESYFRLLAPRVLARLGDASYSLYLTHPIVLLATAPVVASANVSPWLAGMVIVTACIAVSLASYSFIEKPLLAISRMSLSAYQVKAQ
ncbi:hypothetical protein NKH82_11125, partial [Mesorhizobium sp. M0915]|uniref:acyltransferase family protein n=1 Tax=Mesorhizobium sp. M0915 TaxID=2957027 RepID=UPI003336EC56